MPSVYPTSLDPVQANVDNIDVVLAADVNIISDSVKKVEDALGAQPVTGISDAVAYTAGVLDTPNVIGGFNGAVALFPGGTQIGFASAIATQIKQITGAANYLTQPGASLATLRNEPYITNGASTPLTNETAIATVIGAGSLTARPAAGAGNNGWLYFVSADGDADYPNGTVARSNGSQWRNIAFYESGASPAAGDLIWFDDANKTWNRLALGTTGQVLGVGTGTPQWQTLTATSVGGIPASIGVANGDMLMYSSGSWTRLPVGTAGQVIMSLGGFPSWASQAGIMLSSPAVWNGVSWTQYGSIQAAITAAVTGQFVVIPPGTYSENITLKTGVVVGELVAGTVAISVGLSGVPAVTTAADSALIVDRISSAQIITGASKHPILASHASGTCYIKTRLVDSGYTFATSQTGYCVLATGAGTTVLDVDEIRLTSDTDSPIMYGVRVNAGLVYLYANRVSVTTTGNSSNTFGLYVAGGGMQGEIRQCLVTGSGTSAVCEGIHVATGTAGLSIGRTVVSGTGLCYGIYAASTSTSITITRSLSVTSTLDVYGIYTAGGTTNIRGTGTITTTSSSGDAYDLYNFGVTFNVHGLQYNTTKTSGTITKLDGDLREHYILIREEATQNTDGGTFTSGAWRTRVLTTEVSDTGGFAALASNQITLQPGAYECHIIAPAYNVNRNQAKLYNITGSADVLLGTSVSSNSFATSQSVIMGRFTLTAATVLEVQHRCETTTATNGFGEASNFATEVYTVVEFRRYAA